DVAQEPTMGYFDALLRYFEFGGRSGRGQYWQFQFCYALLVIGAIYLDRGNIVVAGTLHPGLFLNFVWIFYASEPGANEYGDDPHGTSRQDRAVAKPGRSSPASSAAQQMLERME